MQAKKNVDMEIAIPEVVSFDDGDVLTWNERTHAYEIRPRRYSLGLLSHAGFTNDGSTWYSHSDRSARRLPEWELIADPETYARLKTR